MNHNHSECEHELKLCKQCDIVYCAMCGKEWVFHALKSLGGQLLPNQVWPARPYIDPVAWCHNGSTMSSVPETISEKIDDLEIG